MGRDEAIQILAVTPQPDSDDLLAPLLGRDELRVVTAQTVQAAAQHVRTATVDCLVCDAEMPDFDGIAFLEALRARDPFLPVIVRAVDRNAETIDRASAARVTDILTPGETDESVAALIETVARRYRSRSGPRPDPKAVLDGTLDPIFVLRDGELAWANGAAVSQFDPEGTDGLTEAAFLTRVGLDAGDLAAWTERFATGECTFDFGTASITMGNAREWTGQYIATSSNWQDDVAVALVLTEGHLEKSGTPHTATGESQRDGGVLDDSAYRRLFRDAINGIAIQRIVTDEHGRALDYVFEDVNEAFERITGLDAEEIQGKRGSTVFDLPDDPTDDPFISRYGDVALKGNRIEFEAYSEPLDQHHRVTAYPLDGDRIAAVFIDITDRVEATDELATYEQIVQRVDDPIMFQDRDGAFQVVNDALVEYAGVPRSELLGTDEFAFMDEPTATRVQEKKALVLEHAEPISYTISPSLRGRGDRSFATTRYPHYDETGTIVGSIAICRDITDLKDRERQLQVLSRVLRHNLRNDLNVITGSAEVLREQTQEPLASAADRILSTGTDMIELVDTERQIVELLTGNARTTSVSIAPLLSAAVETARASFPDGEITLHCPIDARIEAVPVLENAFAELIENGIEHNDNDPPRVSVEATRDGDVLRIDIQDNGPGIPAEEQAVLRPQADRSPLLHGTGLGLWLARYSITHVGGSLRFVDADRGTHIVVTVPLTTD
ncbi:PAS domain S-box protein [Halorhabdus sp. CBA1104]|uniref:hybrid sensor histidine kinase/response regulator n=1 Tax=Halorhabdus sp. CBA1104 TaxID=1380432 RepID=UPI0012B32B0F|nr:PAS domain-containing protein [Halorhabdus sp. CBA1104]QGN06830.1 PAS domain S-box protein [Halorhabdus sp. CBA1104]